MTPRLFWAGSVSPLRCQAVPLQGFLVVLGHALCVVVHASEAVLGISVPLLGSPANPLRDFSVALGHAISVVVHATEVELGISVPLLGGRFPGEPAGPARTPKARLASTPARKGVRTAVCLLLVRFIVPPNQSTHSPMAQFSHHHVILSPLYLVAAADPHHQNTQNIVLNVADQAAIPYPIAPQLTQWAGQRLAQVPWVLQSRYPLVHVIDNASSPLLVELAKLGPGRMRCTQSSKSRALLTSTGEYTFSLP